MMALVSRCLILEPFYSGSHAYWCDVLCTLPEVDKVVWSGKSKWHWRMLCSSAYFASSVPTVTPSTTTVVFSAMMNVAELLGLRPDLAAVPRKLLYVHENQLAYPAQSSEASSSAGQRDFNIVWNQVASCLCVDVVLFNSHFNLESFFERLGPFLNKVPTGSRPPVDLAKLRSKCRVLYVPITAPLFVRSSRSAEEEGTLHIVWPHRWEHDKGPDLLLDALRDLDREASARPVRISVLGDVAVAERAQAEFAAARVVVEGLASVSIAHWGRVSSREEYLSVLRTADVAVSTSRHEFFGVAMLEAASGGCLPLCPKALAYPELFPADCLYGTPRQLVKRLRELSKRPGVALKAMQAPEWRDRLLQHQWQLDGGAPAPAAAAWHEALFPNESDANETL